jgi:hypothetical protein
MASGSWAFWLKSMSRNGLPFVLGLIVAVIRGEP